MASVFLHVWRQESLPLAGNSMLLLLCTPERRSTEQDLRLLTNCFYRWDIFPQKTHGFDGRNTSFPLGRPQAEFHTDRVLGTDLAKSATGTAVAMGGLKDGSYMADEQMN